jgi:hypothetical protein
MSACPVRCRHAGQEGRRTRKWHEAHVTSSEWCSGGRTTFAAIMLILIGSFHALAGLAGVIKDDFYLVLITIDVTVIWALTAHGRDITM